ncbi:MAG: hypothetical protein PHI18_06355, partial [bacterium]|nr:hypothetical protein [bacterium]
ENFCEARLFLETDGGFSLDVLMQSGERVTRERIALTAIQVDSLRALISERIFALAPTAGKDRSGRWALVRATSTAAWGFYSWAIPVAADMEETTAGSTVFTVAALGCLAPLMFTSRGRISEADAILWGHGLHHGILHGMLLYLLAAGDDYNRDDNERGLIGAGIVGGLSEAIAGLAVASRPSMTAGRAAMIGRGGSIGTIFGVGVAGMMDNFEDGWEREAAATILGGAAAGMLAGNGLGRSGKYSVGDAGIIGTSGLIGAAIPISLLLASEVDDEAAYYIAGDAGLLVGTAIGARLVRKVDYSASDSRLALAGTVGGALLGLGIAAPTESWRATAILGPLGALSGFTLALSTVEPVPGNVSHHSFEIQPHLALLPANEKRVVPGVGMAVRF